MAILTFDSYDFLELQLLYTTIICYIYIIFLLLSFYENHNRKKALV